MISGHGRGREDVMAIFIEDGNEEIKDEAVVETEAEENDDIEKATDA